MTKFRCPIRVVGGDHKFQPGQSTKGYRASVRVRPGKDGLDVFVVIFQLSKVSWVSKACFGLLQPAAFGLQRAGDEKTSMMVLRLI